jgi:hypothetical protein
VFNVVIVSNKKISRNDCKRGEDVGDLSCEWKWLLYKQTRSGWIVSTESCLCDLQTAVHNVVYLLKINVKKQVTYVRHLWEATWINKLRWKSTHLWNILSAGDLLRDLHISSCSAYLISFPLSCFVRYIYSTITLIFVQFLYLYSYLCSSKMYFSEDTLSSILIVQFTCWFISEPVYCFAMQDFSYIHI